MRKSKKSHMKLGKEPHADRGFATPAIVSEFDCALVYDETSSCGLSLNNIVCAICVCAYSLQNFNCRICDCALPFQKSACAIVVALSQIKNLVAQFVVALSQLKNLISNWRLCFLILNFWLRNL